jgi:hypothetical protein
MAALELAQLGMAAVLRHTWEPVTRAGADSRVRPRVSAIERQPTTGLGQGDNELCSPVMAVMAERTRATRGTEQEAAESEPARTTSSGDSTLGQRCEEGGRARVDRVQGAGAQGDLAWSP